MSSLRSPRRMDARCTPLVNSPGLMDRLKSRCLFAAAAGLLIAFPALADVPADQAERARELLEEGRVPPPAQTNAAPASLPGAKLDAQILQERERLYRQGAGDREWRQLLGEQQAGRIRQEMTGIPSVAAPARALGFERDQRMRDLSARILQQDQQIRLETRR